MPGAISAKTTPSARQPFVRDYQCDHDECAGDCQRQGELLFQRCEPG